MSALEYRVVTRLLREGSFMEALSNGLKAEHFKDGEAKQIFRFMHQHWFNPNTAKTLPTIGNIKRRWPSFEPTGENAEEDGQLPALINELKHRAFESDTLALANYFQELAQEDPEEAVKVVKASLADLAFRLEGNKHLNILGISETAKQHYEDAITGAIYGIPWPWDCLTEDTLGKSEGEFIMFYGRMKSMKTWVMLHCAVVDYLLHNRRVFIWSKEMSEDQRDDLKQEVQDLTKKYEDQCTDLAKAREQDVMEDA